MKSKLITLIEPRFASAIQSLAAKEMPAAASFQLAKMLKEIRGISTDFETTRQKLIAKYGQKDKDGNIKKDDKSRNYLLKDPKAYNKEYQDLLQVEVEHGQIPFALIQDLTIAPDVLEALVGVVITEP